MPLIVGRLDRDEVKSLPFFDIKKNYSSKIYIRGPVNISAGEANTLIFNKISIEICKSFSCNSPGPSTSVTRKFDTLSNIVINVQDDFSCSNNNLVSLENGPILVGGNYRCEHNHLQSLVGCPLTLLHDFNCRNNELISLVGGPKKVGAGYYAEHNKLESLEGCASDIGYELNVKHNKLTSLVDIHKIINSCVSIDLTNNHIQEGGIGLLLIHNLTTIRTWETDPFHQPSLIISKYLGLGKAGLLECQNELEEEGFEAYTKL